MENQIRSLAGSLPAQNLLEISVDANILLEAFQSKEGICKYFGRCEGCLGLGELDKYCYNDGYGCILKRDKDRLAVN